MSDTEVEECDRLHQLVTKNKRSLRYKVPVSSVNALFCSLHKHILHATML